MDCILILLSQACK